MRQSTLNRYFILLFIALAGCGPNSKNDQKTPAAKTQSPAPQVQRDRQPDQPQQAISNLETKYATCEDKMRPLVKDNNMAFKDVAEFKAEMAELKTAGSGQGAKSDLEVIERKSHYLEYKKSTASSNGTHYTMLGLNEKGDTNPLYFEIGSSRAGKTKVVSLSQRYVLDTTKKECELKLSQSSLTVIERQDENAYQFKVKTIAYDGTVIDDKKASVTLKSDEVLNEFAHLEKTDQDFENSTGRKIMAFGVYAKAPQELKIVADGTTEETVFGQKIEFKKYKVQIINGKKVKSLLFRASESARIKVNTSFNGDLNWTLPFDQYFERIHLGQPQSSSTESSTLTTDYQNSSDKLKFRTKLKFVHDNIAAYFKILKMDERNDEIIYELQENYLPITIGKVIPEDLASNSTIQVELPEVKKIAANIKAKAGTDRQKQIQGILDYLKTNYKYDKEMLKRNVVRPLTTKEAFDRKQGVCQHYSVIFVSIARALEIPSRIIAGYSLSGSEMVKHAWVEAEIESEKWQVIEPQFQDGLTNTRTRFYFPWFRAITLENKDAKYPEEMEDYFSDNIFEFSPVN